MTKKPQAIKKEQEVAQLQEWIAGNSTIVLADYRGLTVSEVTELRNELRKNEVGYKVAKNTLIKRAANNCEITDLDAFLEGPTAIAYANDPIAVTKTLVDFAETHKALEVKAGVVDGKFVSVEDINALANMPSREVLLGRFMGSIQSGLYSFARCVDAIATKMSEGAEAPAAE